MSHTRFTSGQSGKRMAPCKVLEMIEKREATLARRNGPPRKQVTLEHHQADNANEAMRILGIEDPVRTHPIRCRVNS